MTACLSILPPRKRQALPDPQIHLGSVSSYALFSFSVGEVLKKRLLKFTFRSPPIKKKNLFFFTIPIFLKPIKKSIF